MQKAKLLVLVLLTHSLLSCETTKPAPTTSGIGKPSRCGEILVGVTTENRKLEVAGATLKDFSLGKVQTEVTPEFQRIASEASMNEDTRVKIACKAMEMSGGEPSDERLSYYIQLLGFLASDPSAAERLAWAEKVPAPKTAQPRESNPTYKGITGPVRSTEESPATQLARTCKQPIVGLKQRPELVIKIWYGVVNELKATRLPSEHDLLNLYSFKPRMRHQVNAPRIYFKKLTTL